MLHFQSSDHGHGKSAKSLSQWVLRPASAAEGLGRTAKLLKALSLATAPTFVQLLGRFLGRGGSRLLELRLRIICKEILGFLSESEVLAAGIDCQETLIDQREGGRLAAAGGMLDGFDGRDAKVLGGDAAKLLQDADLLRGQSIR